MKRNETWKQLRKVKLSMLAAVVAVLTVVEIFNFSVRGVPFAESLLEWGFWLAVCLVILQVSFNIIYKTQDQITQLYSEAREAMRDISLLFQTSTLTSSWLNTEAILTCAAAGMAEAMEADGCIVSIWDQEEGKVTLCAKYIIPQMLDTVVGTILDFQKTFPLSHCPLTERVLRSALSAVISAEDARDDQREKAIMDAFGWQAALALPMTSRNAVIGLVELFTRSGQPHFTSRQIELCQALVNQVAMAVENVQLLASVEESKDRLEAVIQNMTEGLLLFDARGAVMLINQWAEEFLSCQGEWVAGEDFFALCPDASLNQLVQEALTGATRIVSGEVRGGGNWPRDLSVSIAPLLDERGQTWCFVMILHDITRLKELDRMKSDFVSNVSHNLRTPLANIKLYATLARKGQTEKRDRYLTTIQNETGRLERLIENILDLSCLDRGVIELHKELLSVEEVVAQALSAYQAPARLKGIGLRCDVPQDLPALQADKGRLILMLNDLLSNALKYTPSGGTVRVGARLVRDPKRPALDIFVEDTGIGIPPDEQERIFERFYRGRDNVPGSSGSGLGLTIVKESMALHGGEVLLESMVGQGSTFTLHFPLSPDGE